MDVCYTCRYTSGLTSVLVYKTELGIKYSLGIGDFPCLVFSLIPNQASKFSLHPLN